MRRGTLVIMLFGAGAAILLAVLAAQLIETNPNVRPLVVLREAARVPYGERLLSLGWVEGLEGRALKAVLRPHPGPASPPPQEQARELGRFLIREFPLHGRLVWAEVLCEGDPPGQAVRVEPAGLPRAPAPPALPRTPAPSPPATAAR
ncbi:MAG: hypothetical protein L0216_04395 [Planctomycetales bacterium]|nr:hypothetical protein [Planctomycetales bacterium]